MCRKTENEEGQGCGPEGLLPERVKTRRVRRYTKMTSRGQENRKLSTELFKKSHLNEQFGVKAMFWVGEL